MEKLNVQEAKFLLGLLNEQMNRSMNIAKRESEDIKLNCQKTFEQCDKIKIKIENAIDNAEINL